MTARSLLLSLMLASAGWIAVLAGVMRFTDAAPAALVLFPDEFLMAALPEDVVVLAGNDTSITVWGNEPFLTRRLYDKGALLVLPAGLFGCAPPVTAEKQ